VHPLASPVGLMTILLINIVEGIEIYRKAEDNPHEEDGR
jgi:hypothetical protein